MSLKDTIFSKSTPVGEPFEVPDWGVTIYLHRPTVAEREALANAYPDDPTEIGKAWFILLSAVTRDEDGQPIFGPGDEEQFGSLDSKPVADVFAECLKVASLDFGAKVEEGKVG